LFERVTFPTEGLDQLRAFYDDLPPVRVRALRAVRRVVVARLAALWAPQPQEPHTR
jgi:hypothetical protein